jgi:hypothetical protein
VKRSRGVFLELGNDNAQPGDISSDAAARRFTWDSRPGAAIIMALRRRFGITPVSR